MDGNDIFGRTDMESTICSYGNETIVSADCDKVACSCCTFCCYEEVDGDCHNWTAVANLDPLWEANYERYSYEFIKDEVEDNPY